MEAIAASLELGKQHREAGRVHERRLAQVHHEAFLLRHAVELGTDLAGGGQVHLADDGDDGNRVGVLASDLEHNSLYDILTERYGTHIARARESLEPVLLRTREARLLDQPPRTPALVIEGVAFDEDGTPIEFARTFVRGDRTRYYVERVVVRSNRPSGSEPTLVAGLRREERIGS